MSASVMVLVVAFSAVAQEGTREETLNKLRHVRVTLDFREAPLEQVVDYFRDLAGINLVVDARVREKNIRVTIRVDGITLNGALNLILKPHGCGILFEDGVLQILPRDVIADRTLKMELYDCRDILYPLRDFPGVEITLSGDGPGALIQEPAGEAGGEMPIVELVRAHTGAKSWEENPRASCVLQNGILVVRQTPEVHAQIVRLLNLLRCHK